MGKVNILVSFITIYLILSFIDLPAQNPATKRPFILGAKSHYGFIIAHSKSIEQLSNTNPYGLEVSMSLLNNRQKDWKQCNCYSKTGLAFSYIDFANPKILGGAFSLLVYVEPFITFRKRVFFTVRLGTGVSYITRVYNENTNPANLFFSTPISFPLFVDLNMKFKINTKLNLSISGSYNHISNGGYKQPNKGMNFPTATLGMEYMFKPAELIKPVKVVDTSVRKPHLELNCLYTVKVHGKTDSLPEKTCQIFGLSVRVNKKISRYNAISIGMEWIADGYNKESIDREKRDIDYNRFAITAGHDLLVGSFSFVIQFGYYLYAPYTALNEVYEKYDLQYHFTKNIYTGVFLKAHRQVAELMGVSLGVVL